MTVRHMAASTPVWGTAAQMAFKIRFLAVNSGVMNFKLTLLLQILQGFNHTQYAYKFQGTESIHNSFTNLEIRFIP